ncbi:MAG TPA: hypothetical protein VFS20_32255 [Longimicrobium sp.]|nr:hypothetical protein [Longimicrobium sp.]
MQEVSTARLYALRGAYLLLVVGLGATIWPLLLDPARVPDHMRGVVWAILAAVSLLALLGIRYPLKMLPLLFFEVAWKALWLLLVALPLWRSGQLDAATAESVRDCLVGVILLVVIPWPYVVRHYLRAPGDPWRASSRVVTQNPAAETT